MAKKRKKNLQQLLQKRQQLQSLEQGRAVTPAAPAVPSISPQPVSQPVAALPDHHHREVTHTIVSFAFILLLLGVAIFLDRRTPYLNELGGWLYQALRLNS